MKTNKITILIFLLLAQSSLANMMSPYQEGTVSGSAISSKNIDILNEKINIKIDASGNRAKYIIEYHIRSEKPGEQIPLLFYALDYHDDFKVWMNDNPVSILDWKNEITLSSDFEIDFDDFLIPYGDEKDQISLSFGEFGYGEDEMLLNFNELKFFKVDIPEGRHTIRVEYEAFAWRNYLGKQFKYITESSFRYSLSPAKHWKSFGSLDLSVERDEEAATYFTNLGKPSEGEINDTNNWHFDSLPADFIIITMEPKTKPFARAMLNLFPNWIWFIGGVLLILPFGFWVIRYRKKNPDKKRSQAVVWSIILYPLLFAGWLFGSASLMYAISESDMYIPGGVAFLMIIWAIGGLVFSLFLGVMLWVLDGYYKDKLS